MKVLLPTATSDSRVEVFKPLADPASTEKGVENRAARACVGVVDFRGPRRRICGDPGGSKAQYDGICANRES